jgi:hypothetical protein
LSLAAALAATRQARLSKQTAVLEGALVVF